MKKIQRIVIKFGTESLFGDNGHLQQSVFRTYAKEIAVLRSGGIDVVIVSSGAIAAGRERLTSLGKDDSVFSKKELASIGTRHLFNKWGDAFSVHGLDIAPVLVTYANWENTAERQSVKKSIIGCCKGGMIPVINENDVVSDEEIRSMEKGIGENDRLARMIAVLVKSDAVLFLTNVAGVYEKNPSVDAAARMFKELDRRNAFERIDTNGTSSKGRGGIATKVAEAIRCIEEIPGVSVAIAKGEKGAITRFVHGEPVGTRIGTKTDF